MAKHFPNHYGEVNLEFTYPVSFKQANTWFKHFLDKRFEEFGLYEDAMVSAEVILHHSLLSPLINAGLLLPEDAVRETLAYARKKNIPMNSLEGFIRQIIGWREYIHGIYWFFGEEYRHLNHFDSQRKLLPLFADSQKTSMVCVADAIKGIEERSWVHHIPRLMVLSNLAMLADIKPSEFLSWMREVFIDAADWVMVPNVVGMSMHADGGKMSTKPYVAGGAYISRMSNYCADCEYNPKTRTEDDSCPFTTLYWH